jgi:hypothetical protein
LAGTVDTLAGLAEQVPDDVPLFIENLGPALATPLRYLHNKSALALSQGSSWADLWPALQDWSGEEEVVFLLLRNPPMAFWGGTTLQETGAFALETARTERSYDHLPRETTELRSKQRLFHVRQRRDAPTSVEVSFAAPVWSGALITVDVPPPTTPLDLRLLAAGPRPEPLPLARVSVVWQGQTVADLELPRSWDLQEIVVRLPAPDDLPAGGDRIQLQIHCQTWNPQAAGQSDDARDLGIYFQSLTLGPAGP